MSVVAAAALRILRLPRARRRSGWGLEFGVLIPYSRRHELEADHHGLLAMDAAGFDRRKALALWRNMPSSSSAGACRA